MLTALADTSVLVSALIGPPDSPGDLLLEAHREGEFELISSPRLFAELEGVLKRSAFDRVAGDGRAQDFLDRLAPALLFVDDVFDPPRTTFDRTGDFLTAVARSAGAHYVVTHDEALRTSHVRDLTFLSPTEFVTALDRANALLERPISA